MSYTPTANYALKKIDYNTEDNTWGTILNEDLDTIDNVLSQKADNNITAPIGSIVAWHKSFPNTPALPSGWVECNGQTLSDIGSPYNGQVIPNYNGEKRFLRGSNISGTLENDQLQGHQHQSTRAKNAYWGTQSISFTGANNVDLGYESQTSLAIVTDGVNGIPRYGSETRPVNVSMVWIMRIK